MNKYTFYYRSDSVSGDLCATYYARKLTTALRIFWRDSLNFAAPVSFLLPHYEVMNCEGRVSFRVLPVKYLEKYED